jgi:hypothetical protein
MGRSMNGKMQKDSIVLSYFKNFSQDFTRGTENTMEIQYEYLVSRPRV